MITVSANNAAKTINVTIAKTKRIEGDESPIRAFVSRKERMNRIPGAYQHRVTAFRHRARRPVSASCIQLPDGTHWGLIPSRTAASP